MKKPLLLILFIGLIFILPVKAEQGVIAEFEGLFPSPLKGWEGTVIEVEKIQQDPFEKEISETFSFMDAFASVLADTPSSGKKPYYLRGIRTYLMKAGAGKVTFIINTSNCDYFGLISNPKTDFTPDPNVVKDLKTKGLIPFTYQNWGGLKVHDQNNRFSGIVLEFDTCRILEIRADKYCNNDAITKYLNNTDVKKLVDFAEKYTWPD